MNKIEQKCILHDMAFTQDLINNNFEYMQDDVRKMYLNKEINYEMFRVFSLRHGMCSDGKMHTFSEIAMLFNFDLEKVLKIYNQALKIVAKDVRKTILNSNFER